MAKITITQAIRDALTQEMRIDSRVFILGEDVGLYGGAYGATQGIADEFGEERSKDTPVSEIAIVGFSIGAALTGLRPVPEIMHMDFIACAMDQIVNQLAKVKYMFGGKAKVPVTIRAGVGGWLSAAAQHSQALESWFTHVPGLKVVWPSTPYDVKGLLAASIRDDDPVIFLESFSEYERRGEVPDGELVIPLGKADIKKEGKDISVITYGACVHQCLTVAAKLEKQGISAEVIDLRTLFPWDKETVFESIKKTHKAVVVHQAVTRGGFGSEISSVIHEQVFDWLDAPVKRVGAQNTPVPYSPVLENYVLPSEQRIEKEIITLMA
ncbi:MAG: alpha-ketoacid dehydrogenase subunit beta [Eubacteriales bacterium]